MKYTLSHALLLIAVIVASPSVWADSVHLKNGYILHGKINDTKSDETHLVLDYEKLGFLRIGRDRVLKTEKNNRTGLSPVGPVVAQPAVSQKLVKVQLRQGVLTGDHDPSAELVGHLKNAPDDKYKLLEIPQVGTMRIPQVAIANVQPYTPEVATAPVAASASSIPTTHRVILKNGYKLLGNVVPGSDSEPLVLKIGSLGRLLLPRDRIEKIEKSAGKLDLPPAAETTQADATETSDSEATPAVETGEGTAKVEPAAGTADTAELMEIDPALEDAILTQLYDLGRWRSRDRVRAESHLRDIGQPAIPYLYEISRHPFELTRRAVMRLVRDIGDPAGIPLAIEALVDEDRWVRSLADEALRSLLSVDLVYNPRGNVRSRLDGQKRWREYYENLLVARS